jgi:hypothetical protein
LSAFAPLGAFDWPQICADKKFVVWLSNRGEVDYANGTMIVITFSDRDTEKRALAFLLGRFSGRVLRSGEHLVPEVALEALADQNIPFTVIGKATYEQQMAAIRGDAAPPIQ